MHANHICIYAEVPLNECIWLWDPFQPDGLRPEGCEQ